MKYQDYEPIQQHQFQQQLVTSADHHINLHHNQNLHYLSTVNTSSSSTTTMDSSNNNSDDIQSALVFYENQQIYRIVRMELISSYNGLSIDIGNDVYAKESDIANSEKANLIFTGKYDDCEEVHDQLMKTYMLSKSQADNSAYPSLPGTSSSSATSSASFVASAKKKLKLREISEDDLLLQRLKTENEELKKKNSSLSLNYDRLQTRLLETKTKLFDKEQELINISQELELTKDTLAETMRNGGINGGGGGGGSNDGGSSCACKKMQNDVKDIKKLLIEMRKIRTNSLYFNQNEELNPDVSGETNNLVKLHPGSATLVNRFRFSTARCTESGTAYCQRILTAVFSYQEVIGATMFGRTTANKRRFPDPEIEEPEDTPDNRKGLPGQKLNDLIESVRFHYPDTAQVSIKYNISWKLNNLNKGRASQTDVQEWEGYDAEDFARLEAKYSKNKKL